MSITNFTHCSIHSYLVDKVYCIPDYQREYSWTDEQIDDLWEDLMGAMQENRDHFFGQVVVHTDTDGNYYIIDGQQRTISIVILLAALQGSC